MGIKRFGPVMVVCAGLLAIPGLALAYNHPMHGGEKAPAVNEAVYANQGFYPSRYVIQHCTDAFEGTERWWRWAVVFTDPKAYHNPLCDSVEAYAGTVTFVQVQGGYWKQQVTIGGNADLCAARRLPWGMLTNIFGIRCHGRG